MPRVERDRNLARRRKISKERKKLRPKGFPGSSPETLKGTGKKKPEKVFPKEGHREAPQEVTEPSIPEAS